ncbi:MAG: hypothetical protein L0G27_03345 [Paracoccus sp. (in: a-proteobacteria)]|nr:hypothetical protein [Paracoccus sp. (in: a-proteobacteria)]
MTRAIAIALWMGLTALSAPQTLLAAEAGDAVFSERGPWDLGPKQLEWRVTVEGPAAQGFQPTADGKVTLTQVIDPSDQQPVLQLMQHTETRDRQIGPFPMSSGDPVLTFFLEQTVRDMAMLTGGSPDYIRNRFKDAIFRGGEIVAKDGHSIATFQPFAGDPNAERMQGFETLTLTFVMDEPTAPIREFKAETDEKPGYRNAMVLQ